MAEDDDNRDWEPTRLDYPAAETLRAGARIDEFEIRSVLGSGGFGIVYLAYDHMLQREIALKEYFPAQLAGREATGRVTVRRVAMSESFETGMRSFVNEARLLARFDHPSLLKVHRFWEAHGTAYMVMPYYQGSTLLHLRRSMSMAPEEAWLRRVQDGLLGALEVMHAEQVYHRDVSPDNIVMQPGGAPVLLDFGAARQQLAGQTRLLTAMIKPRYAPIEQYADLAEYRQGPWTDIYATAATMYFCLTGHTPPSAAARIVRDDYRPLRHRQELLEPSVGQPCSALWLEAIDWGLEVKPQDRPQSIAQWRRALDRFPPPAAFVPPEGSELAPAPPLITLPPPVSDDTPRTGAPIPGEPTLDPVTELAPHPEDAEAFAATAYQPRTEALAAPMTADAGERHALPRPPRRSRLGHWLAAILVVMLLLLAMLGILHVPI